MILCRNLRTCLIAVSPRHRVADTNATFEHGNLVRGVCPIAEFSQSLTRRIGATAASSLYMTNKAISAAEAQHLELVHEVSHGISKAKQRGQHVAARLTRLALPVANQADVITLAKEAFGHAECRMVNHGEAKSAVESPRQPPHIIIDWWPCTTYLDGQHSMPTPTICVLKGLSIGCDGDEFQRLTSVAALHETLSGCTLPTIAICHEGMSTD
eukprot:4028966-Prymnesium_polylepis.1